MELSEILNNQMTETRPNPQNFSSSDKDVLSESEKKTQCDTMEYDGKNRCIICKVDMGDNNPRQYCRKTYCESEYLN